MKKELWGVFELDLPDTITRLNDLKKLRHEQEGFISSFITHVYLEESHYCYLRGNYLASIIMMVMAFEAVLKTKFDGNGFDELIEQAGIYCISGFDFYRLILSK